MVVDGITLNAVGELYVGTPLGERTESAR